MSITNLELEKIAYLARLEIKTSDVERYTQDLSRLLNLVEQLQAIDTSGVEPLAHPLEVEQRLREDKVTENVSTVMTNFQTIAPKTALQLYLVPKVIDN